MSLKSFKRLPFLAALTLSCLSWSGLAASPTTVSILASGMSAQVDPATGDYSVAATDPAWSFGGSLATPLNHVATTAGHDDLGDFQQIAFDWQAGLQPMSGQIRIYTGEPLALFSQTAANASETAPAAFPAFTSLPAALHTFSYGHHEFAPPVFGPTEISTPWLLFDDNANALVISPASHFMVASM